MYHILGLTISQWNSIAFRTGMEGFYVAVRGSTEDYADPKVHFTPQAAQFFQDHLGLDPVNVALQLEAWVTTGIGKSKSCSFCYTGMLTTRRGSDELS